MKRLILLSSLLFMLCGASTIYAQNIETVTTSKISDIDKSSSNCTITLDISNNVEKIQSRILDSKVNTKEGFQAIVNPSTKEVSLSFSTYYPDEELVIIFNYLGIALTASDLATISKKIND